MKVFVSWSKPQSRTVAEAFASWLPKVIQACRDPYISTETAKGEGWFQAITDELKASKVGIVFITSENLREEWIHLEAGAMYASFGKRLCPVLVGISKPDYRGPLSNLQLTEAADKADMLKLMQRINGALEEPLTEPDLEEAFDAWWPRLRDAIAAAVTETATPVAKPVRSMEDKVDEILLLVRESGRQIVNVAQAEELTEAQQRERRQALHKRLNMRYGGTFVYQNGRMEGEIVDDKMTTDPETSTQQRYVEVKWEGSRVRTLEVPEDLDIRRDPF